MRLGAPSGKARSSDRVRGMATINIRRVFLGGIVAGIVGNILGFLADGIILASEWRVSKAWGIPESLVTQFVAFNIIGLSYGIIMVWLYAAIRPRFGAGPKTAVYAGLATWALSDVLPNASQVGVAGLFPSTLNIVTTATSIFTLVAAALSGAALYKENDAGSERATAQGTQALKRARRVGLGTEE